MMRSHSFARACALRAALAACLLGSGVAQADQQRDPELRAVVERAISQAQCFADRYDSAVWYTLMEPKLRRYVKDSGERLEILHIARRAVFDFVCTVDAVCKMPFEFLVLSGPANIRRLRARNAMRMNLVRPILYRTGMSDQPVLPGPCTGIAILQELSAQGLSVLAPEPLAEVGEHLRVAFQVMAEGDTLDIDVAVVVRNLRLPQGGAGMIHGLEFKGLDASTQLALRCMVLGQAVM